MEFSGHQGKVKTGSDLSSMWLWEMLTLVPSPGKIKFPLGCRGGHTHLLTPAAALIAQGSVSQRVHSMPCALIFPEFICFNKQMRLLAEQ